MHDPDDYNIPSVFAHDDSDSDSGISSLSPRSRRKKTLFQAHKMHSLESLDYRTGDDLPLRNFFRNQNLHKKDLWRILAKWGIYLLIGVITGIVAFCIKKAVDILLEWKLEATNHFTNIVGSFFIYYLLNTAYALCSCLVVALAGPMAGGSGIPEVKGFLNGVKVEGTINLKTFIGKIFSLILSFSSGLALGPEGPMVHIGSMIGGGLSATKSRSLGIRLPGAFTFERLRTDKEQRDFISGGTAAGIAAAFGAPIGGVLFSIEEASSFWNRELTWRTFFGSMIAAFTVNFMFHFSFESSDNNNSAGLLSFGVSSKYRYRYSELIAFTLLGVIGGLLGALFVKANVRLNLWRSERIAKKKMFWFLEIFVVVTLTATLAFSLPVAFGQCREINSIQYFSHVCDANPNDTLDFLNTIHCEEGYYNDLANLFMLPGDKALKLLFARTPHMFSFEALGVFLPLYFVLVTITAGTHVAAGLFVPMMLIGATYGQIIGRILGVIFPSASPPIDPGLYALVGSAAMMSGFSRTTISLCAIMIELTESTQFLLPLMLAVMTAKWVGDLFTHSIYEELMELKSITYLDHAPPRFTNLMPVNEAMAKNVVCLNEIEPLTRIIEILQQTKHNGFPVICKKSYDRERTYKGMILRKQLLILIETKKYHLKDRSHAPAVMDYGPYFAMMNHKWALDMGKLPPFETLKNYELDISSYVDKSHPIVLENSAFRDAYRTFQSQGLRHLPVVNDDLQVVGILTRHDLLSYHHAPSRQSVDITNVELH